MNKDCPVHGAHCPLDCDERRDSIENIQSNAKEFSIKLITFRNGKATWEESVVMPSSSELKTSQRACHHMLVAKVIEGYVSMARPYIHEKVEVSAHIEMNGLTYKFQMN